MYDRIKDGQPDCHDIMIGGGEQMLNLVSWYQKHSASLESPSPGFLQIGGGIAGDYPISVVPMMRQDLGIPNVQRWSWFCQISDAATSYGGYSGAAPSEKITWDKLDEQTATFSIQSDATIVLPLLLQLVHEMYER